MAIQYMSTEAFTKMVRQMIREEIQRLQECECQKRLVKKHPQFDGQMRRDDERESFHSEK